MYEGSLTKRGGGTLFLTGDDTWTGTSTVRAGKLSVVGSHASPIDVRGGTLGGSGTVADDIDVSGGVLELVQLPDVMRLNALCESFRFVVRPERTSGPGWRKARA